MRKLLSWLENIQIYFKSREDQDKKHFELCKEKFDHEIMKQTLIEEQKISAVEWT